MYFSSNMITFVILFALLGDFLLNTFANHLNIQNLNETLPSEFVDYCDHEQYIKSQKYLKTTTKFDQISSCFDLIVILTFWFFIPLHVINICLLLYKRTD